MRPSRLRGFSGALTLAVLLPGVLAAEGGNGVRQHIVASGFLAPTDIAFASDGRVFVSEKAGRVLVLDSLLDPVPSVLLDLRTAVASDSDRGLLSLALHPSFPTEPWLYLLYSHDALPGGEAPLWGDTCPSPPGSDGCVIGNRLTRVGFAAEIPGPEEIVLEDGWCNQFPSHSIGTIRFGPEGALYVTAGEGASFLTADWGQLGHGTWGGDPCGDPEGEGGALRSQDLETAGDPVGSNGVVLRVAPTDGSPLPDNPLFGHPDDNADRLVAHGLRNPFRMAIDPVTGSLWIGDVGWSSAEEIDWIPNPTDSVVENFGWPCFEGSEARAEYSATGICSALMGDGQGPGSLTGPVVSFGRQSRPGPPECRAGPIALSGVAVTHSPAYPPPWDRAVLFSDIYGGCVWGIPLGSDGIPGVEPEPLHFGFPLDGPAALVVGPGGEIYYPSLFSGRIYRLESAPDLIFEDGFERALDPWTSSVP